MARYRESEVSACGETAGTGAAISLGQNRGPKFVLRGQAGEYKCSWVDVG